MPNYLEDPSRILTVHHKTGGDPKGSSDYKTSRGRNRTVYFIRVLWNPQFVWKIGFVILVPRREADNEESYWSCEVKRFLRDCMPRLLTLGKRLCV